MSNNQIEYSIVTPLFNEEENIPELYKRFHDIMEKTHSRYEIIFVDDGSTDSSLEKLSELSKLDSNVKIISLSRNFGHQMALMAGLDYSSGEAVITIDADLQDPPEVIPEFIKKWKEGYDVVFAIREKRKGENIFKLTTAYIFYRVLKLIANIDIPVDAGDFRLMSRRVVYSLKKIRERNCFLRGLVSWIGFRQIGITYKREKRRYGKTKYPLGKMVKFAFDGITSFTFFPLRLVSYLGFFVSFVCLLYLIYILYIKFFTDLPVIGWSSLMVAILLLGGVQLISIGVVGEYLGRVGEDTKGRPRYIINKIISKDSNDRF